MSTIHLADLEVFYCVGVTDKERSEPQRLLITVDLKFDFTLASSSDRVEDTIDYYVVAQKLLNYGKGRSWRLLEKLVAGLADMILAEFKPQSVTVEVKKFPIPQARYVAVRLTRASGPAPKTA